MKAYLVSSSVPHPIPEFPDEIEICDACYNESDEERKDTEVLVEAGILTVKEIDRLSGECYNCGITEADLN
jgi:hypothetical protein